MNVEIKDIGNGYIYIRTNVFQATISINDAAIIADAIKDVVGNIRLKQAIKEAMK